MYISGLICVTESAEVFTKYHDDIRRVLYNMRIKKFDLNMIFKGSEFVPSASVCNEKFTYKCMPVRFHVSLRVYITTREAMNRFS
jgi:hypothetical protein